jgi:hypothetical protein
VGARRGWGKGFASYRERDQLVMESRFAINLPLNGRVNEPQHRTTHMLRIRADEPPAHVHACCLRLLSIYPYVHSPGRCWGLRHPSVYTDIVFFVRPGTSAAIKPQFLPPCVCTVSCSLLSSCSAHAPVRLVSRSVDARIQGIVPPPF